VNTIKNPTTRTKGKEAGQKDIERAFGVLQALFAVVGDSTHF
jgi:hypothetical protein